MTTTTYYLYRLLLAFRLPVRTRRVLKQASQEGRFLNQLYIRLGRKNWKCIAAIPELKTEYALLTRLEHSRTGLQKRINNLKEQLARLDETEPQKIQQPAPKQARQSDALTGEVRYRKASILKKQREMERIGKVLGKKDPLYQESERELELMRRHLRLLQSQMDSFEQREADGGTNDQTSIAASERQKVIVALQSLKLNHQQLESLMEPLWQKAGLNLARCPACLEEEGKLRGRNKPLLALIRAVSRSHERLYHIAER